jgi:uncharacterized protein involved in outer membrane biogenesis
MGGQVSMENLGVASPPGFQAKEAMSVGLIDVQAEVGSFLSDTIIIDHIDLESPAITLEISTGGSNLGALMDHLKSKTAGSGKPPEETPPDEEPGGPSKKLKVGRVTITSPMVTLAQSLLMTAERTIELPTLELTDIGGGGADDAVTLPQLIEQILGTIMAAVARSDALPADLKQILDSEVIAKYAEQVQQQLETFKDAADKAGEELDKAKERLGKGLGGLLGGDDK